MFQGVLEDIMTLEDNVKSIQEITTDLKENSEKEFGDKLQGEVDQLTQRWASISQLASSQKTRLLDAQDKTQALWDHIKEHELWMEKVKRDYLAREYTVHSEKELEDLLSRFKVRVMLK